MCLLLGYIGNWTKSAAAGKILYKLIIANNRDERFVRRTAQATFWNAPNDHIIGAKEGDHVGGFGTYLGISKLGRVGGVLKVKRDGKQSYEDNVHDSTTDGTLVSRTGLVSNYLLQPNLTNEEYCAQLCESEPTKVQKHYPYHMVAADLLPKNSSSAITATYLSNVGNPDPNAKPTSVDLTPPPNSCGFFAYGNSPVYKPFKKVVCGREEFIDLISKYMDEDGAIISNEQTKTSLHDDLIDFLRSRKKYLPDPILLEYARDSRVKERVAYKLSSRFVADYFDIGTRSQSIILVDTDNHVSFYEWHLKYPIYCPENSEWIETENDFRLNA